MKFNIGSKLVNFYRLPLSKKILHLSYLLDRMKTMCFYSMRMANIGSGCVIKDAIKITPEFISFGDKVLIDSHGRVEAVDCYNKVQFKPLIVFEDGVTFEQRCHITAADKLVIGKNTIASFDVMITDIDHEYMDITNPVGGQNLIVKKTRIGRNCFIGGGAKIQAGTILGHHCIVGANSVVRGEFPDYSVIVGVPGKIVKRYNEKTLSWERTDSDGKFL